MKIRIENGRPASAEAIQSIERVVGARLSASYRNFLHSQDGGEPEHNYFEVGPRNGSGVRQFIPAAEILRDRARIDGIPERAYPIAYDEFGNFILIDEAKNGAVFFWDHETSDLTLVGADFAAFLESLEPFDTESVKLKPGKVKHVWIDPDFRRQHPDLFKPIPKPGENQG
jgi:SMI1-KNR4 cell-wall